MKKLAVVDFDGTLIKTDSFCYMMAHELWFLDPLVLWLSFRLVFCIIFGRDGTRTRNMLKKTLLDKYGRLSFDRVHLYVGKLRKRVDLALIKDISESGFDRIVVASASEEKLITCVLGGLLPQFEVVANKCPPGKDFRTCYGAEKVRRLREYLGSSFDNEYDVTLYTDSRSDCETDLKTVRIVFCR